MTEVTTSKNPVHQGKFGYHPCDYATFLKLKKLHKHYYEALRQYGEWSRWDRKQPQNRLLRKWLRNDRGQKYGCEILGPKPEPALSSVFKTKTHKYAWQRREGDLALLDHGVLSDYHNARHPRATPEEVCPLTLSLHEIDKMISEIEKA